MNGRCISTPFPKTINSPELLAIKQKIFALQDSPEFKNPWATGHNEAVAEVDALYEERDSLEKNRATGQTFEGAPKSYIHSLIVTEQAKPEFSNPSHPDHRECRKKVDSMYKLYEDAIDSEHTAPMTAMPTTSLGGSYRIPVAGLTDAHAEQARLYDKKQNDQFGLTSDRPSLVEGSYRIPTFKTSK